MSDDPSVILVSASNEEPIRLSGPPLALSGHVRLRNPHVGSRVLRHMALSDRSGRLVNLAARHAFRPIVVRSREERLAPVAIALDQFTPPGEYNVDLDVEGHSHKAVLNVVETVALRLEPHSIVLTARSGEEVTKHVIVTNEGNVPFEIDGIGDVELRDDLAEAGNLGRVIGSLLEELPKSPEGVVAALVAVSSRGPVVGHLHVRMHGGPIHLAPGRTARIDLNIAVPADLAPHRRFVGRVAILSADLEFIVAPHGSSRPATAAARSEPKRQTTTKSGRHR